MMISKMTSEWVEGTKMMVLMILCLLKIASIEHRGGDV